MADTDFPTDTALRPEWADVPHGFRRAVETRVGARVATARSQGGGFTPGLAARLGFINGTTAFVKAAPITDPVIDSYQGEARCAALLPATVPTPRLLFDLTADDWFGLVFEDIDGHHPDFTDSNELAEVLRTVELLTDVLTSSPIRDVPAAAELFASMATTWRGYIDHGPPADLDPWSCANLTLLADLEARWPDVSAIGNVRYSKRRNGFIPARSTYPMRRLYAHVSCRRCRGV